MKTNQKMSPYIRALLNALLSALLTVALALLAGKLIESGTLPLEKLTLYSYFIIALASFGGCLLTSLTNKRLYLPLSAITGGFYFLLLCIGNGIVQRGDFQRLLPTLGIVLGAVLIAGLLGARKKRPAYG